jgi:hypothetical protein
LQFSQPEMMDCSQPTDEFASQQKADPTRDRWPPARPPSPAAAAPNNSQLPFDLSAQFEIAHQAHSLGLDVDVAGALSDFGKSLHQIQHRARKRRRQQVKQTVV